jgi:hypothetical protein
MTIHGKNIEIGNGDLNAMANPDILRVRFESGNGASGKD